MCCCYSIVRKCKLLDKDKDKDVELKIFHIE